MLNTAAITPNSFEITRFVPLGNVDAELKRNPSAKVFREIKLTIGDPDVVISLESVTREAASGGYRNGGKDPVTISVPFVEFMRLREDLLVEKIAGGEAFQVVNKILTIRKALIAKEEAVEAVIDLMKTV